MIDHEFRLITPSLKKLLFLRSKKEKTLNKKIPLNFVRDLNIKKINNLYLKNANLLKKIYYRGLPINDKKFYLLQEIELQATFSELQKNYKLNGKQIVQLPNPDYVSFKVFEKNLNYIKNLCGFEVIASWHNKNITDPAYNIFLSYVQEQKLPLCVEVDYFYKSSKHSLYFFFNLIKRFPNIKYWLPHFGCGIFLHWDIIREICKYKPILLSSTNNIINWSHIFKIRNFKNIPLRFASDHPFNGNSSNKIYSRWNNFFNKNEKINN